MLDSEFHAPRRSPAQTQGFQTVSGLRTRFLTSDPHRFVGFVAVPPPREPLYFPNGKGLCAFKLTSIDQISKSTTN